MPAPDGGDDFVWVCGPDERFGVIVCLCDEAVDGDLKIDDGLEDTALQSALGKFGEEPFDRVEPGTRGRSEVECKPRVPSKPPPHIRVLVGGVVVEDDVHGLFGRHLRFNCIQKANELLVTMALHATADDLAFEHVESGEQRCGTVALIVVGHRSGTALLHRQTRLGAIQRLDLRFLIDREDDGMSGWINVKPDNVTQLVDEFRIVGEFELLQLMRLKAMSAPNALDGTGADADCFRHQGSGPMGRLAGRVRSG